MKGFPFFWCYVLISYYCYRFSMSISADVKSIWMFLLCGWCLFLGRQFFFGSSLVDYFLFFRPRVEACWLAASNVPVWHYIQCRTEDIVSKKVDFPTIFDHVFSAVFRKVFTFVKLHLLDVKFKISDIGNTGYRTNTRRKNNGTVWCKVFLCLAVMSGMFLFCF